MECRVTIDKKVQNALNTKQKWISWIMLIIGAIGLITYIVLGTVRESKAWEDVLLIFAIPFTLGLILLINVHRACIWSDRVKREQHYEFQEEKMVVTIYVQGECTGTSEVYYKTLIRMRETKEFLFLYPNKISAFPIEKAKLTPTEYAILKVWIATAMGIK